MKTKSFNIETILHRISKNNDEMAFRELFDHYYAKLLHFSFSLIRNSKLAEEIVLDVFASLWKKRSELCEIEHIESYAFKATKNRTLNAIRDQKKDLVNLEVDSIEFKYVCLNRNPESELLTQELLQIISQAIEALPEKGRLIYRLVKEEEMNYKQVAELLDISSKTVDSHVYSAVKKVRLAIGEYYNQSGGKTALLGTF